MKLQLCREQTTGPRGCPCHGHPATSCRQQIHFSSLPEWLRMNSFETKPSILTQTVSTPTAKCKTNKYLMFKWIFYMMETKCSCIWEGQSTHEMTWQCFYQHNLLSSRVSSTELLIFQLIIRWALCYNTLSLETRPPPDASPYFRALN